MLDGDSVSHSKRWIFGYKLHITSSTGSLIVPLSADFTQADVQDNQIYPAITSSLPQGIRYTSADSGYDDHKLYNLSITRASVRATLVFFPTILSPANLIGYITIMIARTAVVAASTHTCTYLQHQGHHQVEDHLTYHLEDDYRFYMV